MQNSLFPFFSLFVRVFNKSTKEQNEVDNKCK